nr:hypothetical protein [Thermoproteota archaeon]
ILDYLHGLVAEEVYSSNLHVSLFIFIHTNQRNFKANELYSELEESTKTTAIVLGSTQSILSNLGNYGIKLSSFLNDIVCITVVENL